MQRYCIKMRIPKNTVTFWNNGFIEEKNYGACLIAPPARFIEYLMLRLLVYLMLRIE